jgi:hypothetical protein
MKKFGIKIIFAFVAAFLAAVPVTAFAEEPVAQAPVVRQRTTYEAVLAGKALLQEKLTALKAAGQDKWRAAEQPSWAQVYVASWNRDTDTVRLTKIDKSGTQVKLLEGDLPLPYVTLSKQLYSRYRYRNSREIVIGVLYPQASQVSAGVWGVEYVYYVPMDSSMYTPDVVAAGSDYLSRTIAAAYGELDRLEVNSVAFPDHRLTDIIDPYLVKAIVIIEHSSHVALMSDFEPESEMGEFLGYLGLNGQMAYGGSISSAGAQGLAQFIPSTYALMVRNWPRLQLIPDFSAGMADHVNAIKAATAYLDSCLADMPAEVKRIYMSNRQSGAEFLAASYNGGSTRVKWAVQEWGVDNWAGQHQMSAAEASAKYQEWRAEVNRLEPLRLNTTDPKLRAKYESDFWAAVRQRESYKSQLLPLSKASLRTETVYYVKKLNIVYQMLVGGYFATPEAPANALPETVPAVAASASVASPVAGLNAEPVTPELPALGDMVICFDSGGCFN